MIIRLDESACAEKVRPDGAPTIGVVICTRDRPDALRTTLESVWRQTRLPDELLLVDDGAMHESEIDAVAKRCRELDIFFQFLRNELRGLTRARNLAAARARSDVLQFLDDDVTCDAGMLAAVAELMRDPRVAGVTAVVEEPAFASRGARLFQLGYRLAGWWALRPRGRPSAPRPPALNRPDVAVPARWLSGAAMALRRDVVRADPFDESLGDYALGEDREMGYRLSSRYWLLEARQARVIHRRDAASRPDGRRMGRMTVVNYVRINAASRMNAASRAACPLRAASRVPGPGIPAKARRPGIGDRLLIAWTLTVVAAMHAAWSIIGDRRFHRASLRGMLDGLIRLISDSRGGPPLQRWGTRIEIAERRAPERMTTGWKPVAQRHRLETGATGWKLVAERHRLRTGATHRPTRPVLFVTNRLAPGGAENTLLTLVRRLPRFGVEPVVLCLQGAGPLADECRASGTPVYDGALRFKTDAGVILRMHQIMQRHAIDAVVAAHSGGDRMFWSTIAARTFDVPMIVWSHWMPRAREQHFERSNQALYRWVDAFVALGRRHRRAMARHAFVPAGRIAVIPNGIDVARIGRAGARETARRRLGLAGHHVAVAIIANLRPEKRHDVFIAAAAALAPSRPDSRFLVIGDGPQRDVVRAAAERSGLSADVLRLLGARDDVPDLLPGLDVVCLCSEVECFSVVMLEAAAAGCALIGPDVGSLGEFIEPGRTGLLIQPADAASLADAVSALAADAPRRRRLAEAARRRVASEFDADAMARRFSELFERVVARRRMRSRGRVTAAV